jgi:hypothetical protein
MASSVVVDVASLLIPVMGDPGRFEFEPAKLLDGLPTAIRMNLAEHHVVIRDPRHTSEYNLEVFMSKTYSSDGKHVQFGSKSFLLHTLMIMIGKQIRLFDYHQYIDNASR